MIGVKRSWPFGLGGGGRDVVGMPPTTTHTNNDTLALRCVRASCLRHCARNRGRPLGQIDSTMAAGADSVDTEEFNAAGFWRAPIGPPPKEETVVKPPAPTAEERAAEKERALAAEKEEQAGKERRAREEQARKVAAYLMPMPIEKMSYEMIKERLITFQHQWYARHGRKVTPEDEQAGRVPVPILQLYNELGKRLSPEQVASDQAASKERAAAEAEAAAKVAAEAAAEAATRAAADAEAKEARAKEWATFEATKEAAWKSSTTEAKEQRVDAAGSALGERALSGAASMVYVDEGTRDSRPTLEEYIQQAREEFGLVTHDDGTEAAEEAAQWAARGGAAADEVAFRDAWDKKVEAETQARAAKIRALSAKSCADGAQPAQPDAMPKEVDIA